MKTLKSSSGSSKQANNCSSRHYRTLNQPYLGMDAKRRIQQRLSAFVNEQAKATEDASRIQKAWARMPVSIQ